MLRKEQVEKIASAVMDAYNEDKIHGTSDIVKVIRQATMTEKQRAKLQALIDAKEKELLELREVQKVSE